VVTTIAGDGTEGYLDATGTKAQFHNPSGVAVDSSGNLYVADARNHRIRKITSGGVVTTLAGTGTAGFANGAGITEAQFNRPTGVAVDLSGNLYVADTINNCIREISSTGKVTTFAGTGTSGKADTENHRIRKITPKREVTTLAGAQRCSLATPKTWPWIQTAISMWRIQLATSYGR